MRRTWVCLWTLAGRRSVSNDGSLTIPDLAIRTELGARYRRRHHCAIGPRRRTRSSSLPTVRVRSCAPARAFQRVAEPRTPRLLSIDPFWDRYTGMRRSDVHDSASPSRAVVAASGSQSNTRCGARGFASGPWLGGAPCQMKILRAPTWRAVALIQLDSGRGEAWRPAAQEKRSSPAALLTVSGAARERSVALVVEARFRSMTRAPERRQPQCQCQKKRQLSLNASYAAANFLPQEAGLAWPWSYLTDQVLH